MKLSRQIALFIILSALVLTLCSFFLLVKSRHTVLSAAAVPVFALLSGLAAARFLLRPMARLNQTAETIRAAHGDHRTGTETRSELGLVSETLEKLAAELDAKNASFDALSRRHAECVESEKMLKEREEHFRRLFEFSNDAVFIYDFDGKIIDVNNKACDMLGYPRAELLALPFLELQSETELGNPRPPSRPGQNRLTQV